MTRQNKYAASADKGHSEASSLKLRVSFEYLDLSSPHFFVHGLSADHYQKIFQCIHTLGEATEDQIKQQKHPSLFAKSIFNTTRGTYKKFPDEIEGMIATKLKGQDKDLLLSEIKNAGSKVVSDDELARAALEMAKEVLAQAFEVRISRSYGRLHGIVWHNVFYIVWIDPAHNLYPSKDHGIRLHREYMSVQGFGHEAVAELKEANRELTDINNALQAENEELNEAFANYSCAKCSA